MTNINPAPQFSPAGLARTALKIFRFDGTWLDDLAVVPRKTLAISAITILMVEAFIHIVFVCVMQGISFQDPALLSYVVLSRLSFAGILILINYLIARLRQLPDQWLPLTFGTATIGAFTMLLLVITAAAEYSKNIIAVSPMLLNFVGLIGTMALFFFIISTALHLKSWWRKVLWFIIASGTTVTCMNRLDKVLDSILFNTLTY